MRLLAWLIDLFKPNRKIIFISHPFQDSPKLNQRRVGILLAELHKENPDTIYLSPLHLFGYINKEKPHLRKAIMWVCYVLILVSDEVHFYWYREDWDYIRDDWKCILSEGQSKEEEFASKVGRKTKIKEG